LLTFFILTFRPAPIEGQLNLRLPPPQAVATVRGGQQAGRDESNPNPIAGVESLIISVFASPSGDIDSMAVGEGAVSNLRSLDARLRTILSDQDSPFEQVILQVSSRLRYQALMDVINVCAEQRRPNGQPLGKLSFVELPDSTPP
jgi:biopolymer transport protein ExbD